jgi:hypothetical protein
MAQLVDCLAGPKFTSQYCQKKKERILLSLLTYSLFFPPVRAICYPPSCDIFYHVPLQPEALSRCGHLNLNFSASKSFSQNHHLFLIKHPASGILL